MEKYHEETKEAFWRVMGKPEACFYCDWCGQRTVLDKLGARLFAREVDLLAELEASPLIS